MLSPAVEERHDFIKTKLWENGSYPWSILQDIRYDSLTFEYAGGFFSAPLAPNAGAQPLPKAGATEERTLEAVGCSAHLSAPAQPKLL